MTRVRVWSICFDCSYNRFCSVSWAIQVCNGRLAPRPISQWQKIWCPKRLAQHVVIVKILIFIWHAVFLGRARWHYVAILRNLDSAVHRHSWWCIIRFYWCDVCGCCVLRSRGAVLKNSSGGNCPLESILASAPPPLWRSRISPIGVILLIAEIPFRRLRIYSTIFCIATIACLSCKSELQFCMLANGQSTSWFSSVSANLIFDGVLDVTSITDRNSASSRLWPTSSPEWLLSYPSEKDGSIVFLEAVGVLAKLLLIAKSRKQIRMKTFRLFNISRFRDLLPQPC